MKGHRHEARRSDRERAGLPYGLVWQGARYEGLVTVWLEVLGGFGGRVLEPGGAVALGSDQAVRALGFMRRARCNVDTTRVQMLMHATPRPRRGAGFA